MIVLQRLGLYPGAEGWLAFAVEQLRIRRDELVADGNAAARLAEDLARRVPVIYGGGGLGGPGGDGGTRNPAQRPRVHVHPRLDRSGGPQ